VTTRARRAKAPAVVVYDRNAVLTIDQVALGLQLSVRSVESMNLPVRHIGTSPRFIWGEVLDSLVLTPVTYPRDAVLTIDQVARGLQISVRSVERADFPSHYIRRMPRFIWGEILEALGRMRL
jgi:hypothetical protein